MKTAKNSPSPSGRADILVRSNSPIPSRSANSHDSATEIAADKNVRAPVHCEENVTQFKSGSHDRADKA